jgi:hypothetical protein
VGASRRAFTQQKHSKSKDDVCDRCDGIGSIAAPPGLAGNIPGYRLAREASEEHGAI